MAACSKTRDDKCDGCTLTGPTTLAPGAEGTWVDDKTNSGEWRSTHLNLKERTSFNGYKATMPSGGQGPFVVKVCYGDDERTCCETTVDFPPCSLTGPSTLAQGQAGEFTPSLGLAAATATVNNMVLGAPTPTAFSAMLAAGACSGSINIFYGGRLCGSIEVADSYVDTVGTVVGDSYLEPGSSALYTHNIAGATYTGTLDMVSGVGNNAILRIPESASVGDTFTASWTGRCGVSASMTVTVLPECAGAYDAVCPYGGLGIGPVPRWAGARVLVLDALGSPGDHRIHTVVAIDTTANTGLAVCDGQSAGAWSVFLWEGYGWVMAECNGVDIGPTGLGYVHDVSNTYSEC